MGPSMAESAVPGSAWRTYGPIRQEASCPAHQHKCQPQFCRARDRAASSGTPAPHVSLAATYSEICRFFSAGAGGQSSTAGDIPEMHFDRTCMRSVGLGNEFVDGLRAGKREAVFRHIDVARRSAPRPPPHAVSVSDLSQTRSSDTRRGGPVPVERPLVCRTHPDALTDWRARDSSARSGGPRWPPV